MILLLFSENLFENCCIQTLSVPACVMAVICSLAAGGTGSYCCWFALIMVKTTPFYNRLTVEKRSVSWLTIAYLISYLRGQAQGDCVASWRAVLQQRTAALTSRKWWVCSTMQGGAYSGLGVSSAGSCSIFLISRRLNAPSEYDASAWQPPVSSYIYTHNCVRMPG